ncbi:MAG: alpha/beta fold hydrolase [Nitrospiraceae bacterium]|nr:alpha/beta fold hydrolase [Nitrospiraceae bacterium]
MPLIKTSPYRPPVFMRNAHIQTLYPPLFRKLDSSFYQRERITTNDHDFLDLDWSGTGSPNLAIISHGLEGSSRRSYVVGMARALNQNGWDVLAWNFRSCSGEINRQLCFYHSGSTDDLERVIQHATDKNIYSRIVLIGFSLGGNVTLVYLGKKGSQLASEIVKSVVFSVPCDLRASSLELARPGNIIYMKRFLALLHKKIQAKMRLFPGQINDHGYRLIKNFHDYDNRYTAPLHGFKNAEDYWATCSSRQYIPAIKIPTLIVNALNDPFLAGGCYPWEEASRSTTVALETPKSGGHTGFVAFNKKHLYWSEKRAVEFLNGKI